MNGRPQIWMQLPHFILAQMLAGKRGSGVAVGHCANHRFIERVDYALMVGRLGHVNEPSAWLDAWWGVPERGLTLGFWAFGRQGVAACDEFS